MKTRTVVEISNKELIDVVADLARKTVKPGPGPVHVEIRKSDGAPLGVEGVIATVTFEWGAKPNGG
jgi:hypothetical protein